MSILVITPILKRHLDELSSKFPNEEFKYVPLNEVCDDDIKKAEIVFGQLTPEQINQHKNVKWVQLSFAGYDPYLNKGIRDDVILTSSVGAYNLVLAEYALGGILILQKNFHLYMNNQRKHIWENMGEIQSIAQSKALIIGLGHAGAALAEKLNALGCKVDGIRKNKNKQVEYVNKIYGLEDLNTIIGNYNIIVVSISGSEETHNILNKSNLTLCQKDSIIVNFGRGYVIDDIALADILKEKKIRGCVLDVTYPEPLPSDHPLWDMENAIITPHTAGGFQLESTIDSVVDIFAENLKLYKENKELNNIIKEL